MYSASLNEPAPGPDRLQIAALIGLMLVGTAFVYSATMVSAPAGVLQEFRDNTLAHFLRWVAGQFFFKQMIWYGLGLGAAAALCIMDYRTLTRWSLVAYWATIIPLVLVLVPGIGTTHGWGAMRWIDLGFFQFQPSEFGKLALILVLAHYLSRPVDELRSPKVFWTAIGLTILPFILIMKEPDLGSALVLLPTSLAVMFVAGVPTRHLVQLLAALGLLGTLFLVDILFAPPNWQLKLQDYQRRRLLVYFGRSYTPSAGVPQAEIDKLRKQQFDDSHNVRQALISVGSGGLTGNGWREGTQNRYGYLPRAVAHNDFIFSVIAEEKGFVGSVTVITLYAVVLFTGLRIAGQARDRLGKLLAVGVVALIFSQVFINIGMNIRLMPVTGVPLPLLSYGGSSVLTSLIAMGMLQNVHIHRKTY